MHLRRVGPRLPRKVQPTPEKMTPTEREPCVSASERKNVRDFTQGHGSVRETTRARAQGVLSHSQIDAIVCMQ